MHELGHALVAAMFTKDFINIQIGNGKLNKNIVINRINIKIKGYNSIMDIFFGQICCESIKNKTHHILILLAGPFVSLIISIITIIIIINFKFNMIFNIILQSIFFYSFTQFVITIIPIEYKFPPYNKMKSDGCRIKEILKNNNLC